MIRFRIERVERVQKELVKLINHNDNGNQLNPDSNTLLPHKVIINHKVVNLKMKGCLVHIRTVILLDYFTVPNLRARIYSSFCYMGHYCSRGKHCPYLHVDLETDAHNNCTLRRMCCCMEMVLPDCVLANLSKWVDSKESNADWSQKYELELIKNHLLYKRVDDVESDNNMDNKNEFNKNFVSQVKRVQKELVDLINHNDNEDQLIPDADILLPHKVVKLKMKGFLVHNTTDKLLDYITTYPSGTRNCSNFCYVGHYCTTL